jgi:hypothetical protein
MQPREKWNMKRFVGCRLAVYKLILASVAMSAIAGISHAADGSIDIYTILDDSVAHIEQ